MKIIKMESEIDQLKQKVNNLKLTIIDLQESYARDNLIHEKLNNLINLTMNNNKIEQLAQQNRQLYKQYKQMEQELNIFKQQIKFELERSETAMELNQLEDEKPIKQEKYQ